MTSPSGDLVPFGKYKGRPVVDLMADRSYTDWLAAQPWFRQRYGTVYNLIIGGAPAPQDTPEHNAMQATFLNHGNALRVCSFAFDDRDTMVASHFRYHGGDLEGPPGENLRFAEAQKARITSLRFEYNGWDLVATALVAVTAEEIEKDRPCSCECQPQRCALPVNQRPEKLARPAHVWSKCYSVNDGERRSHCERSCRAGWNGRSGYYDALSGHVAKSQTVAVELKPTIGDDYPSILRDVNTRREMNLARGMYPSVDLSIVLAGHFESAAVSYEQAKQIFKSRNVLLLTLAELPAAESWRCRCQDCSTS